MKSKSLYPLLIIGFLLLMLLLLLSACMLFVYHHGWDVQTLYRHYAGDQENFLAPKSWSSILKSFSPHLLVMPLSFFILFHLLVASKAYSKNRIKYLAIVGFGTSFGDIIINFFIPFNLFFAYVKYLFFILFQLSFMSVIYGLFQKSLEPFRH